MAGPFGFSTVKGIGPDDVSSTMITFVSPDIIGFEFVGARTTIWNVRTVVGPPSEAVTLMVAEPVALPRTTTEIVPVVAPGV